MRKVFLEDLPRYEDGRCKGKINWSDCIGKIVYFIYKDFVGNVEIINYQKEHQILTIKYNDREFNISTSNFVNCKLGRLLGKYTSGFKVEIGQVFKDYNRDLTIIDIGYKKRDRNNGGIELQKLYKYKCNKCGFDCGVNYRNGEYKADYWIEESNLLIHKKGCACCCSSPKTVVPTINSIFATDKWMVKLGIDESEAIKFTSKSNKKIKCICPYCESINFKTCNTIYRDKSISCRHCGDGVSYPEKFVNNVLSQINIDFQTQYNPKWIGRKRYDFYIPMLNMIIEVHGEQHYKETSIGRSLLEEQENDRIKKESAIENGVEHYIVLDCRESNMEWIKNSILKSALNELFNLSNIDWLKSDEYALNNLVKIICNYWSENDEYLSIENLTKMFGLCRSTIVTYLKKGSELGWCNYNVKKQMMKSGFNTGKSLGKQVEAFKNGVSMGVFESASELERISNNLFGTKLSHGCISLVCNNKQNNHKGFTFQYI